MRSRRILASGLAALAISGAIWAGPPTRSRDRPDDTTMRFDLDFRVVGDDLLIGGFLEVVNPDAPFDHDVVVRMKVRTIDGEDFPDVDLFHVDYHRGHPRNFLYPVHHRWTIDNRWGQISFVAEDAVSGSEFCSAVISR